MSALADDQGPINTDWATETDEDYARACAARIAKVLKPLTDAQLELRDAIRRGEKCCVHGCDEVPNRGHKHDMSNPFNH